MAISSASQAFQKINNGKGRNFSIIRSCGKDERLVGTIERIVLDYCGDLIIEYRNTHGFQIKKVSRDTFWKIVL